MSVKKQANGKWGYYFGHKGKRYRKQGFATKRAATEAETKAMNALLNGMVITNDTPFIDYYDEWIKVNKKDVITDKAYATYINSKNQLSQFLEDEHLSGLAMSDFNTTLYRKFIKWYGKDHATESVRKLHNCIKQSIEDAVQDGKMTKDPTYKAVIKGTKPTQDEEDKFMRIQDFKGLKEYVEGVQTQSYVFVYILIITGARFGEVQKMIRSDLNFKENTIHLRGTKTETSDRIISVPKTDMQYLKSILSEMPTNISGQLFNTGNGLITHNAVSKVLNKYCLENKLGKYTLHALRHTHCSFLLHEGVSIYYISKRLGHKNIKTTLDVYSHLLEETAQEENEKALSALSAI